MRTSQPASQERLGIVEALIGLVAEHGYEEASLAAVVERAGVDEAAFHRHFSDLEDCFVVVWEHITALYMPEVLAAFRAEGTWREQIRATGIAMVEYLAEHPDHACVLCHPGRLPGPRVRAVLSRNIALFAGLVDLGRQEMDDPDSLSRATADGLAGAVHEQIVYHVSRGEIEALLSMVGPVMYMVVRPYLGDEIALEELRRS